MAVTVGIDLGTSNTKLVRLADGGASTLLSEPTPTEWSALFGLVVAGRDNYQGQAFKMSRPRPAPSSYLNAVIDNPYGR